MHENAKHDALGSQPVCILAPLPVVGPAPVLGLCGAHHPVMRRFVSRLGSSVSSALYSTASSSTFSPRYLIWTGQVSAACLAALPLAFRSARASGGVPPSSGEYALGFPVKPPAMTPPVKPPAPSVAWECCSGTRLAGARPAAPPPPVCADCCGAAAGRRVGYSRRRAPRPRPPRPPRPPRGSPGAPPGAAHTW